MIMEKVVTALNKIGTNLWACVVIAAGLGCFAFKEREGGLMLVTCGATLFKTKAEHEQTAQS